MIENLSKYKPKEEVGSDFEPFVVPGLPDLIVLMRSQVLVFGKKPGSQMGKPEDKSFGVLVNSFYELELEYLELLKRETNKKTWLVGPVSVNNRTVADKTERQENFRIEEDLSCPSTFPPLSAKCVAAVVSHVVASSSSPPYTTTATEKTFHGPCYVVGDNIDTDQIIRAEYLTQLPSNLAEYKKLGSYTLVGLPALYATRFVELRRRPSTPLSLVAKTSSVDLLANTPSWRWVRLRQAAK